MNIAINARIAKIAGIEMNTFETRRKGGTEWNREVESSRDCLRKNLIICRNSFQRSSLLILLLRKNLCF
jgi:hypothetical protein